MKNALMLFAAISACFISMLIFCRGDFAVGVSLLVWNFINSVVRIKIINKSI